VNAHKKNKNLVQKRRAEILTREGVAGKTKGKKPRTFGRISEYRSASNSRRSKDRTTRVLGGKKDWVES